MICARTDCNKEFIPNRTIQVYCSPRCQRLEGKRRRPANFKSKFEDRVCVRLDCSEVFTPIRSTQVYHSIRCRDTEAARRYLGIDATKLVTKVCAFSGCGKEFTSRFSLQKYCFSKCRQKDRHYIPSSESKLVREEYRQSIRGREPHRGSNLKYKEQHPDRIRATMAVSNAIQAGDVIPPDECSVCKSAGVIHGHHYLSYERQNWYNVIWLCAICHKKVHNEKLFLQITTHSEGIPQVESSTEFNVSLHAYCQTWLTTNF